MKVPNEDHFRDFVSGLNEQHDYNGIRWLLEEQARQPCGWVRNAGSVDNLTGKNAPITEEGYRMVAELQSPVELFQFASRIIENEGFYLVTKGGLDGLLGWYGCEKGLQSLERMRDEIRGAASSPNGWVSIA